MRIACFCICLLLASCVALQQPSLPVLRPVSTVVSADAICTQAFTSRDWQFVHSITFTTDNGRGSTLIGVTVLQAGNLRTVLMGVEGLVLFEAEQQPNGKPVVRKAMPPFNKMGFAEGLMADVRTLFVEPSTAGRLLAENKDGELVCRYSDENKQVTDVVTAAQGWDSITLYDDEGKVRKTIIARQHRGVDGESIPQYIQLKSTGTTGYTLHLELLSADKL